MGRKKELKRPPPLVTSFSSNGSPIPSSTTTAAARRSQGSARVVLSGAASPVLHRPGEGAGKWVAAVRNGASAVGSAIHRGWLLLAVKLSRNRKSASPIRHHKRTNSNCTTGMHIVRDPAPTAGSRRGSWGVRRLAVVMSALLLSLAAVLWSLLCAVGELVASFASYSGTRRRRACHGGIIEDGELVDGLNASRSGSAKSSDGGRVGSSSMRKVEIGSPSGGLWPEDHGDGGTGMSRGGSSYYYDVEEGQFQPSQRLLFRRTGTELNFSRLLPDTTPSPLTIGSKLYQITAGMQQSATAHMRSVSRGATNSASPHADQSAHGARCDAAGYFTAHYGDKVGRGSFHVIACIGRGTYSSVWLAMDIHGVTARIMPAMMQRMEDHTGYNSSASILSGGLQHAFVVLKVSRCLPEYVRACEEEFATSRMLLLELQRRGFSSDHFVLYPTSFLEPVAKGRHSQQQSVRDVAGQRHRRRSSASPPQPTANDQKRDATEVHMVQVGEVCGPSLLSLVTDAPPTRCGLSMVDRRWRLASIRCIARQLLEALEQLHQCGVIHSDLKPENVLFSVPAVEFLEKMRTEERNGYFSASQRASMHQNLILARHRLDLVCHANTWRQLLARHKELGESGMEANDATQSACAVKLADLGSSLRLPIATPVSGAPSPQKHGSGSWGAAQNSLRTALRRGPPTDNGVGGSTGGSNPRLASLPSSQTSSFAGTSEADGTSPSFRRPILPGQTTVWLPQMLQTREYRAPEVVLQLHPNAMVSTSLDIWSVGCVVFELVTGHYLMHPRLVALQRARTPQGHPSHQGKQQHDATVEGDEAVIDSIHLQMMADLLCQPAPGELRVEGLNSAAYFAKEAPPLEVGYSPVVVHERKVQFILALLHFHLNPETRHANANLAASAALHSPPDGGLTTQPPLVPSGDAAWDQDLQRLAQFLAATLHWLPWQRPSAAELLHSDWIRGRLWPLDGASS